MAPQGIAQEMDLFVIAMLEDLMDELLQATHARVEYVQLEKGEHGYDHLVVAAEVLDEVCKVAQGAEKPMQQHEGFSFAYFQIFEFAILLDLVRHLNAVFVQNGAKIDFFPPKSASAG
jgi:hypothetical protein